MPKAAQTDGISGMSDDGAKRAMLYAGDQPVHAKLGLEMNCKGKIGESIRFFPNRRVGHIIGLGLNRAS